MRVSWLLPFRDAEAWIQEAVDSMLADSTDEDELVLVDDGIATGASMIAAVRSVRQAGAAQVVVAVPVGPSSVCRELRQEADDVVCSTMPPDFHAVGQVFADFHQVDDDEVRAALAAPTVPVDN